MRLRLDAKLVKGGRGGYCFEQNLLFGHVLRALGFKVQEATARVRWSVPPGVHTPRVHALLIVEAEGESYLVDVGFGGNVATSPLMLKSRDEQKTPHEPFRLVEEDHRLVVEAKIAGEWTSLYATDLAESIPADFEMGNWFTSAHPESIFVNGLLAARADPDRRYALFNNALSMHKLNGGTEKRKTQCARTARRAWRFIQYTPRGSRRPRRGADAACGERLMSRGRNGPRQPGGGRQQAGPRGRGRGHGRDRDERNRERSKERFNPRQSDLRVKHSPKRSGGNGRANPARPPSRTVN